MYNATIFKEEIQSTFKETFNKSLFIESLKNKNELTLAEAIYVLSNETLLNEGIFGKMGGLVDKGIETIANKIVGAKDSIANWAITKLGGQVTKKPEPTPFDGAKTILPIAKMAKDDQPGFFEKVAKMTGNTTNAIKELYMKLEASYENIPLVGKIASKVPKGWRTVILALIVIIVAGVIIYKEKTGQSQDAPTNTPTTQATPTTPIDTIPTSEIGKLEGMMSKIGTIMEKNPEKGKALFQKFADVIGASVEEGKISEADAVKMASKILPVDKAQAWVEMALQAVQMKNKLTGQ